MQEKRPEAPEVKIGTRLGLLKVLDFFLCVVDGDDGDVPAQRLRERVTVIYMTANLIILIYTSCNASTFVFVPTSEVET